MAVLCAGVTGKNRPCKKKVLREGYFCHVHGNQAVSATPIKGATAPVKPILQIPADAAVARAKPTLKGPADGQGRMYAEGCEVEDLWRQGFRRVASRPGSSGVVDVLKNGFIVAKASHLKMQLPAVQGCYIWLVRPPGGRTWVPVYLGKAGGPKESATLRTRVGHYLHDVTFGPFNETNKYCVLVDLQSRGFSVSIRWMIDTPDAVLAESQLLARYNFALNTKGNGSLRTIQLPSGKLVTDFKVIRPELAQHIREMRANVRQLASDRPNFALGPGDCRGPLPGASALTIPKDRRLPARISRFLSRIFTRESDVHSR